MAENNTKVNTTNEKNLNEKVKIKLIAYRKGHNKARYLGIGSKTWLIPRGVEIELPRYAVMRLEKQGENINYV